MISKPEEVQQIEGFSNPKRLLKFHILSLEQVWVSLFVRYWKPCLIGQPLRNKELDQLLVINRQILCEYWSNLVWELCCTQYLSTPLLDLPCQGNWLCCLQVCLSGREPCRDSRLFQTHYLYPTSWGSREELYLSIGKVKNNYEAGMI